MIEFNQKDINLVNIQNATGLLKVKLTGDYRVYGLKNADNPAVLLEYDPELISDKDVKSLTGFFVGNGIDFVAQTIKDGKKKSYLGLRHDLRQEIDLSVAIINTIVYLLEGKMKVSKEDKIAKVPDFAVKITI
jgi:hypothetical protein